MLDLNYERFSPNIVFPAAMVITIVLADLLFLRHHTVTRLVVNTGIVLVYLAIYWRFFKRN